MSAAQQVPEPTFVICNPAAGRGRGVRVLAPLLEAIGDASVGHALTREAGHETELAQEAIERGFTRLVTIGGDGTWSNVANGILKSGKPARLALVAGGTGCDFAKTVGIPAQDVRASARVVLEGVPRRVDVGRVEGRHFLNIAGFGYDIAVLEASWNVRWLNGDLRYVYCALRQMRSYPGFRASLALDGSAARPLDLLMLIVANARHFGGAFRIAPEADLTDGRLDVVTFDNLGFWQRPSLMGRLMRGTHAGAPGVRIERAARLSLAFEAPPAYETDGEWRRAAQPTLTIESVPGALELLVPAEAGGGATPLEPQGGPGTVRRSMPPLDEGRGGAGFTPAEPRGVWGVRHNTPRLDEGRRGAGFTPAERRGGVGGVRLSTPPLDEGR